MGIKIIKLTKEDAYKKVRPDIVYNRYDLFCKPDEFHAVKIKNGSAEKVVEYRLLGEEAELGIWLVPISQIELEHLLYYIKNNHPKVKAVSYKNALIAYGKSKSHNNFRIVFPETGEEMKQRISSDSWHKMRRRNRRAAEKYGEMTLEEYTDGNIPLEIVQAFFDFKLATHNREYPMTTQEYLDRYHVSDCYVVKFGDVIGAMHFTCEQGDMVYGENHGYNPDLREYSLGKFIFTHSLVRIVEKGRKEIFLGGGNYEYKTHWGSFEETVYDGRIQLSEVDFSKVVKKKNFMKRVKRRLKKMLKGKK